VGVLIPLLRQGCSRTSSSTSTSSHSHFGVESELSLFLSLSLFSLSLSIYIYIYATLTLAPPLFLQGCTRTSRRCTSSSSIPTPLCSPRAPCLLSRAPRSLSLSLSLSRSLSCCVKQLYRCKATAFDLEHTNPSLFAARRVLAVQGCQVPTPSGFLIDG